MLSCPHKLENATIGNIGDGVRRNSNVHMTHFVSVHSLSASNYSVGS